MISTLSVYERISAVLSLSLIGLALYFVLDFPAQTATVSLFATPLSITRPHQWLMAFLLVALTMVGTDRVMRSHPDLIQRRLSYLASCWMLPGLLVLLATQTLGLAATPVIWGIALVGVGVLLGLTLMAEYRQLVPGTSPVWWAYLWRQLLGYGLALALFVVIYHTRSRSALSATAILLVSAMAALALLRHTPDTTGRMWLFALVIGLIMSQITWALNYWRADTLSVALFLLLIFYVLNGIAQQHLSGKFSRRSLWAFGGVAVMALLLILYV